LQYVDEYRRLALLRVIARARDALTARFIAALISRATCSMRLNTRTTRPSQTPAAIGSFIATSPRETADVVGAGDVKSTTSANRARRRRAAVTSTEGRNAQGKGRLMSPASKFERRIAKSIRAASLFWSVNLVIRDGEWRAGDHRDERPRICDWARCAAR